MTSRICVDGLMPVAPTRRWKWSVACHLFHLDYDLEALDAFALSIGMKRAWRHDSPGFVHYDLHTRHRALAVAAGARELSIRDQEYRDFVRGRRQRLP